MREPIKSHFRPTYVGSADNHARDDPPPRIKKIKNKNRMLSVTAADDAGAATIPTAATAGKDHVF